MRVRVLYRRNFVCGGGAGLFAPLITWGADQKASIFSLGAIHRSPIPHRQHYLPEFEGGEKTGGLKERMLIVQGGRKVAVILTARASWTEASFEAAAGKTLTELLRRTHARAQICDREVTAGVRCQIADAGILSTLGVRLCTERSEENLP
jgi:hypothetical protein